jgi:hypothetical protein
VETCSSLGVELPVAESCKEHNRHEQAPQ